MDPSREPRKSGRREFLNDARRTVERALFLANATDELAEAAQMVLSEAEVEQVNPQRPDLAALGAALDKYRKARDG